jgi:hypothetical protein
MIRKISAVVAGASFIVAMTVSAKVLAAVEPDASRLSSQYAAWAGGKANADALVNGLASGSTIMLMTRANNTRSLAGFTPQGPLSSDEIAAALSAARSTLSGMGIRQPTADQIQAALIGGEITLADGRTRLVQGAVVLREAPLVSPVAAR